MSKNTPIAEQRLVNQRFYSQAFRRPGEVVAWLGAIQGQDYGGAKWSIGLRLPGSSDRTVEQAIDSGRLLRIWAMRGTLHFVAAEDVHWLLRLLAPRVINRNTRRYRQLELDEATLIRSSELLAAALENGERLNRDALREILENAGISTKGQRLVYMLQRAVLERLICQGTAPKNKPLFHKLPPPDEPDRLTGRDEALAELASRYFTSRGPAMLEDFIWWSGLTAGDARTAIEAAGAALSETMIDGRTYWQGDSPAQTRVPAPEVMLLPGFDEFLVAYRDRSASIRPEHHDAWSRTNAMFSPTLVRRGRVIGLWKRTFKKDIVKIEIEPFIDLNAKDRAGLEEAAADYGRFQEKTPELSVP